VTADPIHDIGLFLFEAAWVALGVALLRANRRQAARDVSRRRAGDLAESPHAASLPSL
jgi:hypothetical protein